jgi:hypothetical protein
VVQNLLDRRSLQDGRDDPELAATTVGAVLHVDVKDALEQPGPGEGFSASPDRQKGVGSERPLMAGTVSSRPRQEDDVRLY